jgi:AcrR family transcriptional regulator
MASPVNGGTSLREQQRAFTRERLLRAGAEVFARKGYLPSTIDDIVSAAGASRATFYLHFHTKAEVIRELGSRLLPEVRTLYQELDEVLVKGDHDAMRGWMSRALEWMETNKAVMAALDAAQFVEEPMSHRDTMKLADQMPRYLASWPEHLQHQARMRIALLAAQFRATYSFLLGTDEVRADIPQGELVDVMTDIWMTGLRPPSSAAASER